MLLRVNVAFEPSFTDADEATSEYADMPVEVSLTVVDAVLPPAVTVSVSEPSVRVSAKSATEIVA